MTTFTQASFLENQLVEDGLIFNALNPGSSLPLLGALTWGREDFAEYALTNSGGLARYLDTGNTDAFITGVFGNALGRAPSAGDLSFYEHVVSAAPSAFQGFADVIMYVGLSAESYGHNHGLAVFV